MPEVKNTLFTKKLFVFTVNLLLGIIAVLLMRDRDKNKIIEELSNTSPENYQTVDAVPKYNTNNEAIPKVPDIAESNVNLNENISSPPNGPPAPAPQNSKTGATVSDKNNNIATTNTNVNSSINKNTNTQNKNTNTAPTRKTRTS